MNWGDNWVGAHLIQSIDLQAYTLQPTISYKFWDKLSVGVGMTITWGTFDLSRSMFPVGEATNNTIAGLLTAAGQGQYAELFTQAGDRSLVSARIKGDAKTAIGVNVGILWDITPEWTLGFSYRSKVKMKVASGTANLLYASPEIGPPGNGNDSRLEQRLRRNGTPAAGQPRLGRGLPTDPEVGNGFRHPIRPVERL
jgi:long-chain fatty acid transport protein